MKILNSCSRILAVILILIIIFLLPMGVVMRSLGGIVFNQEELAGFIDDSFFDQSVLAELIIESFDQMRDEDEFQDNESQAVLDALAYLNKNDMEEIINEILPEDLMEELLDDAFTNLYDWLESDKAVMDDIVLDMRPLKDNLADNGVEVLKLVFDALPPCTDEQEEDAMYSSGDIDDLPICRPSDEYYDYVIEEAEYMFPDLVEDMEDELVLLEGSDLDLDDAARQSFKTGKVIFNWFWIIPALMIFAVIPLGARSFGGILKWPSVPLLVSGVLILITALIIFAAVPALITSSMETTGSTQGFEPMMEIFARNFGRTLSRPILITGVVLSILGVLGLALGFGLDYFLKQVNFGSGNRPGYKSDVPDGYRKEPIKKEEDGDPPQGMFG